mmetsp:Transcript_28781/g.69625  ORF Transcript_28781/g.69625 Transcript_28781/m.69625 type:complete len:200 (+) Transcript_28781:141-740(+)
MWSSALIWFIDSGARVFRRYCHESWNTRFLNSRNGTVFVFISCRSTHTHGSNYIIIYLEHNASWKGRHLVSTKSHHGGHLTKLGRCFFCCVTIAKGTGRVLVDDATVGLCTAEVGYADHRAAIHTFRDNSGSRCVEDGHRDGAKAVALADRNNVVGNRISLLQAQCGDDREYSINIGASITASDRDRSTTKIIQIAASC